jgi:hypothetical protein
MTEEKQSKPSLPAARKSAEVEAFLHQVAAMPSIKAAGDRARLIFALDATASREATWDRACHIQGEMFEATEALGGLDVQLVFYRGFRECKASRWLANAGELHAAMRRVSCVGGNTQIGRVLVHVLKEAKSHKASALVFVGDAMEENVDDLSRTAGELGLMGVPIFVFHEGADVAAGAAFRQLARLSGGAYCHFDAGSARQLRELLGAVAAYAAGGRAAMIQYGRRAGGAALLLAGSLWPGGTDS